nr:MAG TPA: hypothetical protein [Bacteriophage sp.]
MIGRIFSILRAIWSRPAVQASVWLVIESIAIWLKDWIVTFFKKNSPCCNNPKQDDYTPGETKSDCTTTRRAPKNKKRSKVPLTLATLRTSTRKTRSKRKA